MERGLSGWTVATAAMWEGVTLAYITIRPDATSGLDRFELSVHAYAPIVTGWQNGSRTASVWDRGGYRGSVELLVRAYPIDTGRPASLGPSRHQSLLLARHPPPPTNYEIYPGRRRCVTTLHP